MLHGKESLYKANFHYYYIPFSQSATFQESSFNVNWITGATTLKVFIQVPPKYIFN